MISFLEDFLCGSMDAIVCEDGMLTAPIGVFLLAASIIIALIMYFKTADRMVDDLKANSDRAFPHSRLFWSILSGILGSLVFVAYIIISSFTMVVLVPLAIRFILANATVLTTIGLMIGPSIYYFYNKLGDI